MTRATIDKLSISCLVLAEELGMTTQTRTCATTGVKSHVRARWVGFARARFIVAFCTRHIKSAAPFFVMAGLTRSIAMGTVIKSYIEARGIRCFQLNGFFHDVPHLLDSACLGASGPDKS